MKRPYSQPETEILVFRAELNIMSPYNSNGENMTMVDIDDADFWG